MDWILRGFIIGFAIAAPVGPIAIICIRRTLAFGRLSGLVSGLGAASADAVYGAVAALGLTAISSRLISAQDLLRVVGGVFLFYLGVRTFFERPRSFTPEQPTRAVRAPAGALHLQTVLVDFISMFLLTITNPMTILSFSAIFVSLGAFSPQQHPSPAAFWVVVGVFAGSAAWWLLITTAVGFLRSHFLRPHVQQWVSRISGAVILVFGTVAVLTGVGGWVR